MRENDPTSANHLGPTLHFEEEDFDDTMYFLYRPQLLHEPHFNSLAVLMCDVP